MHQWKSGFANTRQFLKGGSGSGLNLTASSRIGSRSRNCKETYLLIKPQGTDFIIITKNVIKEKYTTYAIKKSTLYYQTLSFETVQEPLMTLWKVETGAICESYPYMLGTHLLGRQVAVP